MTQKIKQRQKGQIDKVEKDYLKKDTQKRKKKGTSARRRPGGTPTPGKGGQGPKNDRGSRQRLVITSGQLRLNNKKRGIEKEREGEGRGDQRAFP